MVLSVDSEKRRYAVRLRGPDRTTMQVKLKPECCSVRCPCADESQPCGSACADACLGRAVRPRQHTARDSLFTENGFASPFDRHTSKSRNLNMLPDESTPGIFRGISACAAAHRSIVLSLSPEQRSACYPLACFERFGYNKWTTDCATDDCASDGVHSRTRCTFRL